MGLPRGRPTLTLDSDVGYFFRAATAFAIIFSPSASSEPDRACLLESRSEITVTKIFFRICENGLGVRQLFQERH